MKNTTSKYKQLTPMGNTSRRDGLKTAHYIDIATNTYPCAQESRVK